MKLLIIDINPYGVLTDVLKWTTYLVRNYDITVLCFSSRDSKTPKVDKVRIHEVPNLKNRYIKASLFFLCAVFELLFHKGKTIVVYFPYCELLKKLFPKKKMLLDIRTLSVNPNLDIRYMYDSRIKSACRFFDKVSAVSAGVANPPLSLSSKGSLVLLHFLP